MHGAADGRGDHSYVSCTGVLLYAEHAQRRRTTGTHLGLPTTNACQRRPPPPQPVPDFSRAFTLGRTGKGWPRHHTGTRESECVRTRARECVHVSERVRMRARKACSLCRLRRAYVCVCLSVCLSVCRSVCLFCKELLVRVCVCARARARVYACAWRAHTCGAWTCDGARVHTHGSSRELGMP